MLSRLLPLVKYYPYSADGVSAQQKEAADARSQVSKCENSAVRQAWLGRTSVYLMVLLCLHSKVFQTQAAAFMFLELS